MDNTQAVEVMEIQDTVLDPGGRPTKYFTNIKPNLDKIKEWTLKGYTDYAIAKALNVSARAYSDYKREYLELQECYDVSSAELNANVVNALYKSALGYKETSQSLTKDGKVVELQVYYPPNPTSIQVWLYNNMPNSYKRFGGGALNIIQNNLNIGTSSREISTQLEKVHLIQGFLDFIQQQQLPESLDTTDMQDIEEG